MEHLKKESHISKRGIGVEEEDEGRRIPRGLG